MQYWYIASRRISLERPLVMGILNVTPDSFSDGGRFMSTGAALKRAEELIGEGADIIDIGGESTRPGSSQITANEEISRVVPIIEAISSNFDTPISIDTSKSEVAQAAADAGAEIINDISGLRWDERIAEVAAVTGAGLVLMHSRGSFVSMHDQEPMSDVIGEVSAGLRLSIDTAKSHGVEDDHIALDIGIGFGKTFEQNLELLAKIDKITGEFRTYPMLVGTSRKSFIGRILDGASPSERLGGSIATAVQAVIGGASIVRVHDVKDTVSALRVIKRISEAL